MAVDALDTFDTSLGCFVAGVSKDVADWLEDLGQAIEADLSTVAGALIKGESVPGVTDAGERKSANLAILNREQTLVQSHIDTLKRENPDFAERAFSEISKTLNAPQSAALHYGVRMAKAELPGGQIDFADKTHRLRVGELTFDCLPCAEAVSEGA